MSVHDRWHGKRTGDGQRWLVRWRDVDGSQHKRRFDSRAQADLEDAKHRLGQGTQQRRNRKLTVAELMSSWLATTTGTRESTQVAYQFEAKLVCDQFGDRLAVSLRPSEVRTWAARQHPGPSIRRRSLMALRRAYRLAIADGLLETDPTAGAKLPRQAKTDMRFLSWQALAHLADCSGDYGPLIWLLGTSGLRLSEAAALNVEDVDRVRRRVRVRQSKTGRPRDVPVSQFVLDKLPGYQDFNGDSTTTPLVPYPLFTGPSGGRLNPHNWREREFRPAAERAGLAPMHPHELRHTAASLAIASGADAKVVQRMLGHRSAAMTMDTYSHLFDSNLDSVTVAMERARLETVGELTG